jgi:hypothetical protein
MTASAVVSAGLPLLAFIGCQGGGVERGDEVSQSRVKAFGVGVAESAPSASEPTPC